MFSTKHSQKYSHYIFSQNATQGTSCLQDIYDNIYIIFSILQALDDKLAPNICGATNPPSTIDDTEEVCLHKR